MMFAHPLFLLLFLPLLLVAIFAWTAGVRRRGRIFFPTGTWINKRPRFTLPSPFRVHYFLRLLALSFLIIAVARPQKVKSSEKKIIEAVDIIISFDLSKSMDALDFKPNRHVVAVNTVNNFIASRMDDRIGLVLFAGEAYLAVPLTTDHKILQEAVVKSNYNLLQDGTAIGQSLAVGVHHLSNSKAKSRIVILVTDGDNNMGSVDPVTAAELAKGYGIKIYTIGIGKKGRVPFPIKTVDAFGRETEVYQYLTDAVNDELLADIAQRTGGRFFRADDQNLFAKVFDTIDKLEKTKVETNTLTQYTELAWPFIILGMLVLFAEGFALNTRWRKIP
jgi:Ca-activated chloride channel family protein